MSDVISIVAGGHSFEDVDQAKVPGRIIAVNGAARYLRRRLDHVVTMDRLWCEDFWPWAFAVHNYPNANNPVEWTFHARDSALKNIRAEERRVAESWVRVFECDDRGTNEMSRDYDRLNGNHSGRVAMNLAFQIWPKTVYLFGFDMCKHPKTGRSYWYEPYKWVPASGGTGNTRLQQWAREMVSVRDQFEKAGIEVVNVSRHSIITAFKKVSPRELGVAR